MKLRSPNRTLTGTGESQPQRKPRPGRSIVLQIVEGTLSIQSQRDRVASRRTARSPMIRERHDMGWAIRIVYAASTAVLLGDANCGGRISRRHHAAGESSYETTPTKPRAAIGHMKDWSQPRAVSTGGWFAYIQGRSAP